MLDAAREPLVRVAVAQRGDRDVVVRTTGAVGELEVVEQPRVVGLGEGRHPTLAERVLERVLVATGHGVELVQQQHDVLSCR